jgi:chromosome segregation ATPase
MSEELAVAEQKLGSLEERISKLELEATKGPVSDNLSVAEEAVKAYQIQLVDRLKEIRDAIKNEDGDIVQIRNERDAAISENKKLKIEIERLGYRVRHLIKNLDEEERKHDLPK